MAASKTINATKEQQNLIAGYSAHILAVSL
jgi:hypothetical protein